MIGRAVYRWAIAVALAAIGLIGIMLGLHLAPIVLARPAGAIINCSASIQACINSASNGDTIVVTAGNYTESLTLNKPVSLTGVSAPSVTIKAISGQRVLTVTGSAISNSVVISGLTLIGGNLSGVSCPNSCGGGMLITNNASPIIQNTTIQNNAAYRGGGVRIEAGSVVTLINASLVSNTITNDGGGINLASGAILTLIGGRLENNRSSSGFGYGGGVLADGTLTVSGTNFISNSVTGPGGGVYATLGVVLTNGRFERNHSSDQGGGLRTNGAVTATDTTFVSNTALQGGGLNANGAIDIVGGSLESNTATTKGGGVYALYSVSISGTQILSNTGPNGGGGVFGDWVELTNDRVENNAASQDRGGGVFAHDASIVNTDFINNSAQSAGGGLYAAGTMDSSFLISLNIVDSAFERNSLSNPSNSQGGGLFAEDAASISGTQFLTNSAGSGGGAYISNTATLSNVIFSGNTSPSTGGGLYTRLFATVWAGQFISNSAEAGGGLYSSSGAEVQSGRFENNAASFNAGGTFVYGPLTLIDDQFTGNTAVAAAGGAYSSGTLRAYDSHFENNRALTNEGGALFTLYDLEISKTSFISNSANLGGGAYLYCGQGYIVNSLFARNTASTTDLNPGQGAALLLNDQCNSSTFDFGGNVAVVHTTIAHTGLNPGQAMAILSGTLNVTNTIIVNHAVAISTTLASVSEDYNLYFGNGTKFLGSVSSGGHTVGSDPRFANAAADDYHLALNSPAIDAGINAGVLDDFEGDVRPQGIGFDIGFDEVKVHRIYLPLMLKNR